jgi:outer membrane protein OmpA-like peptidoglycan-associated protein
MRRQGSKPTGRPLGAAIAATLLIGCCLHLSPSGAQSPKSESGSAVSPPSAMPPATVTEPPSIASDRPTIVLDFHFTDDLTDDAVKSQPEIAALAKALSSQDLKSSTFVIACHAMASGRPAADQALSERCADTIRRVLVEKFGLAGETLVAVGYGSAKPKNPADPSSVDNQRLEIVNMGKPPTAVSR